MKAEYEFNLFKVGLYFTLNSFYTPSDFICFLFKIYPQVFQIEIKIIFKFLRILLGEKQNYMKP